MPKKVPTNYCIHCTLPTSYCVCAISPSIKLPENCSILFHPRELARRNSTGRLLKMCTNIQSIPWHRLDNEKLEARFKNHYLIYPQESSNLPSIEPDKDENTNTGGFLWIDSTWQESHKMLRQSPWLKNMRKYSIKDTQSTYKLRRNQTQNGLSTLECLAYWLNEQNRSNQSKELLQFFQIFQEAFLHARQAGLLK